MIPEAMKPSWKVRRRVVITTLLFCAGCVIYLLIKGQDSQLNQSIANGVILLAGSVIGGYIFGATWDDRNVMRQLGPKAFDRPRPSQGQLDWQTPPENYLSGDHNASKKNRPPPPPEDWDTR